MKLREKKTKDENKKPARKKKLLCTAAALVLLFAAVQVVPTFFGGVTDADFADGGLSTTLPVPEGDPMGQSAEDNIFICIGVMNGESYRSETKGSTSASVGFIDYTQQICGERIVTEDSVFNQTVSTSALVKVGEQKYFKDGAILMRKADSVNGSTAVWSDEIFAVSQEDYSRAYGQLPRNVTNYVVSEDTVCDPELRQNGDGSYTISFALEPDGASAYYKRQIYTYSGASQMPVFTEVRMEWTMDSTWRLISIKTVETYEVTMTGLGSMSCTSNITETFSDYGSVKDEQKEFLDYLETKYDPNKLTGIERDDALQEELLAVFENTPNLNVTATVGGKQYIFGAHLDLEKLAFQMRGTVEGLDVYGAYQNNKLFLHVEDQKIVLDANDTLDAANKMLGSMGIAIPDISLEGEAVQGIVNGMDVKSGKSGKTISFNDSLLKGSIRISGKETPKLVSAELKVSIGGSNVTLSAVPAESFKTEKLTGYTDLTQALSLIDPIMNTVNAKGCTADLTLSGNGMSFSGRVQISGVGDELRCAFTTTVDGVPIKATLLGDKVYAEAGNIRVSGSMSEIETIIGFLSEMSGGSESHGSSAGAAMAEFFSDLSVKKAVNAVSGLSWYDNALHCTLDLGGGLRINAAMSRSSLCVSIGGTSIKLKLVYSVAPTIAVPQGSFVSLSQLEPMLDTLMRYVGASGMEMTAELSVGGVAMHADMVFDFARPIAVKASSVLLGKELCVTLYDGSVYVSYGALKVTATEEDLRQALESVLSLIPSLGSGAMAQTVNAYVEFFDELSLADIVGAVSEFYYADGALHMTAHIADDPLYISMTPDAIRASTNVGSLPLSAVLSPGAALSSPGVTVPQGNYLSLDRFLRVH